jgi:ketosteroid isomerase-like protein
MSESKLHDEVTIAFLEGFLDAWNRHDIDAILATLDSQCTYITGSGTRFEGHDQIRRGLGEFLQTFPDAHWRDASHFVSGDRGASEWVFTATTADGKAVEMDSCDLFTFKNGKIAVVSAFRRDRPA